MKKRILALALAGTTAFSVFGAAMSANAAGTSTHVFADNDAYVSYTPVAKTIISTYTGATVTEITYIDMNEGDYYGDKFTDTENTVEAYIYAKYDIQEKYDGFTKYYDENGNFVIDLWDDATVTTDGSNAERLKKDLGIIPVTGTAKYRIKNVTYDSLKEAMEAAGVASSKHGGYWNPTNNAYASDEDYAKKADYNSIEENIVAKDTGIRPADGGVTVKPSAGVVESNDPARDWYFNADTTGEATIDFMVYDYNGAATKSYQPTIFAYDFVYANANTATTAANIASVWNNPEKSNKDVAAAIGKITLKAETGFGIPYNGIRSEVVNEWIDFLEELAIYNDGKNYCESEADFISLYSDMYYGDPIYSAATGKLIGYDYVDLYNIDELLHDIYALNTPAAIYNANTSEMVYLMQQYKHYIGEYINIADVETSDWGALLLSILESADADDFKKAPDYKKYVNRVEELADAYEAATTANMIKAAEQGMYDLLTNSTYRANTASKAELNATMEGLYFNVGSVPTTYTTEYKTLNSTNVDYKNFSYYYAFNLNSLKFEQGTRYYSLYPQADYAEKGNAVDTYTGNSGKYTETATDEYEWFLNVYELAANMKKGNLYQGSIDAVNAALEEAVEALDVTVTPYNSEVAAKEDMMDYVAKSIKEETDYDKNYYGMYTKAVDYAENVAEGKMQQWVAREIVGVSGDALTWQGTQVTVSKNDMKTVRAAIADGKAAIEAIKNSSDYNAAQVTALNKAIAKAQAIVDLYDGVAGATINHADTNLVADKDQIVKSDLTAAIEGIEAAIDYSEIVMGWSKNDAGKWMYGTDEGYLDNGWNKIGSVWYYFDEDGTAKESEWFKDENGKWYWFNSNCGAAIGWAKVDGDWYYFGGNNAMKTGWQKVDGNWYYLASSGKMTTGWVQVDGKWYYMSKESNSLGQMLANTTVEGYKLGADGAMIEK